MKFLVDESTGAAVVGYLRSVGHDVLGVSELMPQADDQSILARAASEERIVVTNDKDFGQLVFRSCQPHRGVLLLRLRDESPEIRVAVVKAVLNEHADQLFDHFTVATETGVRISSSHS